jgi:hypothetical protein
MDTLKKLREDVLRFFDLVSETPGSIDADLVEEVLNRAHQIRCGEKNWRFMRSRQRTIAITAGQQSYTLPFTDFTKMNYLWSDAKGCFFHEAPDSELGGDLGQEIALDENSGSYKYYDIVRAGDVCQAQPTTDTLVEFAIFDADDADKEFYIEGENSSGEQMSEVLSAVDENTPGVSANQYSRITYYEKRGEFVGSCELNVSPNGFTLINLGVTEFKKEYPVLRFKQVPSVGDTLKYTYFRTPRVADHDHSTFDIPFPHTGILLYDALLDCATYSELDSESVNIWREKQEQLKQNLYFSEMNGDSVGARSRHTQEG